MFEKGPIAVLPFRGENNSNKQRKDKVSKYVYLSLCVTQFLRSYFLNFSDVLSFPLGAYTCLRQQRNMKYLLCQRRRVDAGKKRYFYLFINM